jgi:hypothetical protein
VPRDAVRVSALLDDGNGHAHSLGIQKRLTEALSQFVSSSLQRTAATCAESRRACTRIRTRTSQELPGNFRLAAASVGSAGNGKRNRTARALLT